MKIEAPARTRGIRYAGMRYTCLDMNLKKCERRSHLLVVGHFDYPMVQYHIFRYEFQSSIEMSGEAWGDHTKQSIRKRWHRASTNSRLVRAILTVELSSSIYSSSAMLTCWDSLAEAQNSQNKPNISVNISVVVDLHSREVPAFEGCK